jgi:hypothetical protein
VINFHVLAAQDDEAARMEAHQDLDGHDIEIWDLERMVAKLRHHAPNDFLLLDSEIPM